MCEKDICNEIINCKNRVEMIEKDLETETDKSVIEVKRKESLSLKSRISELVNNLKRNLLIELKNLKKGS